MTDSGKGVAIVHDALCVSGGAERVALYLAKAFPGAPIYTSVYLPEKTFPEFKSLDVRTLPFSNLAKSERGFKVLWPLWYKLIQKMNLSQFDTVISNSTYLAKYIRVPESMRHVAYIQAPFRWLWKPNSYTEESLPLRGLPMAAAKGLVPRLQKMDVERTREIPTILANSRNMAAEIERVYDRKAEVLYPPVTMEEVPLQKEKSETYLTVSRLISHKRVDIAVEACSRMGRKLIVVGDGPEKAKLQQLGGSSVEFSGRVSDEELKQLYGSARALLFCSEEDLGLTPVEAQAAGTPVIAYGKGGALETIQDGVGGLFFEKQNPESLMEALKVFESCSWNAAEIRESVRKFDEGQFLMRIQQIVAET